MPNYGVAQAGGVLTCLYPGESLNLFDAEAPAALQASVAFSQSLGVPGPSELVFTAHWATAPTASVVNIEASMVDVEAQYQILQSIVTGTQGDGKYADDGRFRFYRAKVASITLGPGAGLTVIAQR